MTTKATVEIRVVGSEALRELTGVTRRIDGVAAAEKKAAAEVEKAAKRAAATQVKESQKAARAAEKAAKQAQSAQTKASKDVAREAARQAAIQKREADRLTEYWGRLSHKSADQRIREEERVTRAAAREAAKKLRTEERTQKTRERDRTKTLRNAGGFVGGAIGGIVAGATSAFGTARGIAGVDDVGTRVQRANASQEQLIITATNAGLSRDETTALRDKVLGASVPGATDQGEIISGLVTAHERFNALGVISQDLEDHVVTAKAADTAFEDFVGMLGSLQSAFGLTADELKQARDLYVAGAQSGAISMKDFAGPMAPAMGTFAMNTGQKGLAGAQMFMAMMQTIGAGQFGAADTETRGTQFVSSLNKESVVKDLEKLKTPIKVRGDDGKIDVGSVLDQIARNPELQTPMQMSSVWHDVQQREGLQALLMQRSKTASSFLPWQPGGNAKNVSYAGMMDLSPAAGSAATQEVMTRLQDSGILDLQRQAIEAQNEVVKHLGEYNEQILAVTKATLAFEKALGTTGSLWGGSAVATGVGAGAGALAGSTGLKMLGGGGGAAAGGSALAGGGALAGMAGTAALWGAGALGAGMLGYFGTKAIGGEAGGEWLGNALADLLGTNDDTIGRDRSSSTDLAVEVNLHDNRTEVKAKASGGGKSVIRYGSGPLLPGSL